MTPSLDLGGFELRRFTRAKLTRLALAGLVMLPLLYAGLYLWSFWDPYRQLNRLPVALVVLDQPVESGGKKIAAGPVLAKELVDRKNFDWRLTDPYSARAGVADGTYYFSLTIPPDFSAKIASPDGQGPVEAADLQVETNDSTNYVIGTIAQAALNEIKATASANATTNYFDGVFVSFGTLHDSLEQAAEGAEKLDEGAAQAQSGAETLAGGIGTAEQGSRKLASGAKTLANGLGTAQQGGEQLASGARTLANGLGTAQQGTEKLAAGGKALANGLGTAQQGSEKLATGGRTLVGGLGTAEQGSGQLSTGARTLEGGIGTAHDGSVQLSDGLAKLGAGSKSLAAGSSQVAAGISTLTRTADRYGDELLPFLSTHVADIQRAADAVAKTANAVGIAATELPEFTAKTEKDARKARADLEKFLAAHPELPPAVAKQWRDIADQVVIAARDVHGYVDDHSRDLKRIRDDAAVIAAKARELEREAPGLAGRLRAALQQVHKLDEGGKAVATGAVALDGGVGQAALAARRLADGLDRLDTGAQTLALGADGLHGGLGRLSTGAGRLAAGQDTLTGGIGKLSNGAGQLVAGADGLDDGLGKLAGGAGRLATGANGLNNGLGRLTGGANQLVAGENSLTSGLAKLNGGAGQLSSGLGELSGGAGTLAQSLSDGAGKVPLYSDQERADRAAMMAAPVQVKTEKTNYVPNYGTGFAPFFVPLSLWVGAMIAYMLLKPLNGRALAGNAPPWRVALAGLLPAVVIGALQTLVLLLVLRVALGLHAQHWFGLIAFLVLGATAFAAVVQWANAQFGTLGKVVALVLLMLQLTSAAGTYPIETSPAFFRTIQNFLPMSWVVRGMRRLLSGGELAVVWQASLVLLTFTLAAFALTMLATRSARLWSITKLHPALRL